MFDNHCEKSEGKFRRQEAGLLVHFMLPRRCRNNKKKLTWIIVMSFHDTDVHRRGRGLWHGSLPLR